MRAILASIVLFTAGFAPSPFPKLDRAGDFVQRFTLAADDAAKGYGVLEYEATVRGCKADVAGGRLFLRGDHEEGDQRLYVRAQKAIGKEEWPDSLKVTVRLGGTANDNVAWHVGVSVGRVKMLFHPNLQGGAFRVETTDTHDVMFNNQDVGFTPAADVTHLMTVNVRRTKRGYQFDVALEDAKGNGKYQKRFEVNQMQMGRFNRVGLERSGRRGGDALFELLTIKAIK